MIPYSQITRKDNRHLDPLLSGIQRVQKQGSNFTLTGSQITLDDMLPNDLGKFFKYSGSLTTPPCSESVTWFVFKEITGISLKQIQYFREIMTMNEEHVFVPIGHNVRSLQKLRKRDVLASFSSASFIHQSMSVTLSSIFLFMSIKLLNRF
jgi:carbonic anhydrase